MIKKIISTLLCLSIIISLVSVANAADTELVNVALNKTVKYTTGRIGEPENLETNLVDGSYENIASVIWDGANTGVGFLIDLGKTYSIEEIKIHAAPLNNPSGRDQVWVDYSADNSSYTNIYARNMDITDGFSSTVLTDQVLTLNDFGTIDARYIKVYSWTYTCWSEVEVFATITYPTLVKTEYNQKVITTEFSEEIDDSTVNADTFKLYADDVELTANVDYTLSFSGKNIIATLSENYEDTHEIYNVVFKAVATTGVYSKSGFGLKEDDFATTTSPSALAISDFTVVPDGNSANVSITITNNRVGEEEIENAVVFAFIVDENNTVYGKAIKYVSLGIGESDSEPFTVSAYEGVTLPENCSVMTYVWKGLSNMQPLKAHNEFNLN